MKFMLMMQGRNSDWEALGSWAPADFKAHVQFMLDLNKELVKSGELVLNLESVRRGA